ncbi:hypothetical protein Sjap_002202 [Stephania japonica]|uniref:UBX domain-containing protein n=1 Tax=Stephania japonica TaxID=461633 RepID=A0AAP0KLE8_9MAGN
MAMISSFVQLDWDRGRCRDSGRRRRDSEALGRRGRWRDSGLGKARRWTRDLGLGKAEEADSGLGGEGRRGSGAEGEGEGEGGGGRTNMECVFTTMDDEKQMMVSSFLEIAVGQSAETARLFLQATSWKLDEAIQLFYVGNDKESSNTVAVKDTMNTRSDYSSDGVRSPIPVRREALYEDDGGSSRMDNEASSSSMIRVWDEENLASLYRPPFALMYDGPFEQAKQTASMQDKWLIVNLQSTTEFASHMLNRDTWANEAVAQTISTNFIFWQAYDDTTQGMKVCTYYKLDSAPVVDNSFLCRVAFRFPGDGRRCQRTFLRTDPLKLLWSFCRSHLQEADKARPFRLTNVIPGASKVLDYESEMTLGESDLANSMISAFRRLATSMDKFSKVASEEVPGTLSSLKLSGLEINDLTQQLMDKAVELRNELASRNPENGALASWSGDPCLPLQWEGLQCEPISDKSFIIDSIYVFALEVGMWGAYYGRDCAQVPIGRGGGCRHFSCLASPLEQSEQLPIYEPGLDDVVKHCRGKNLFFKDDVEKHVARPILSLYIS